MLTGLEIEWSLVGGNLFYLAAAHLCALPVALDRERSSRGGAILKGKGTVHGTATAASIWHTGLIGMAVALGRFSRC